MKRLVSHPCDKERHKGGATGRGPLMECERQAVRPGPQHPQLRKVCVTSDVVSLTKDADAIQVPGIRLECLVAGLRW